MRGDRVLGTHTLLQIHRGPLQRQGLTDPHTFSRGSQPVVWHRPIRVIHPVARWFSVGVLLVAGSRARPSHESEEVECGHSR
jgi:hypothetical protein